MPQASESLSMVVLLFINDDMGLKKENIFSVTAKQIMQDSEGSGRNFSKQSPADRPDNTGLHSTMATGAV